MAATHLAAQTAYNAGHVGYVASGRWSWQRLLNGGHDVGIFLRHRA